MKIPPVSRNGNPYGKDQFSIHSTIQKTGLLLILIFLHGCFADHKTVVTLKCNGQSLSLISVNSTKFGTETRYLIIRYQNKPIAVLDDEHINKGLPYSSDVYNHWPLQYIDTVTHYDALPDNGGFRRQLKCVLYIDPGEFSENEFIEIANCLQENYVVFQKGIDGLREDKQPFQIGGLVYGSEDEFIKRYDNGARQSLEIFPDGRIAYISWERGIRSTIYNDKGPLIVMPGKRMAITDTLQMSVKQLKDYRNDLGKSITVDFDVYVDIRPQGR